MKTIIYYTTAVESQLIGLKLIQHRYDSNLAALFNSHTQCRSHQKRRIGYILYNRRSASSAFSAFARLVISERSQQLNSPETYHPVECYSSIAQEIRNCFKPCVLATTLVGLVCGKWWKKCVPGIEPATVSSFRRSSVNL